MNLTHLPNLVVNLTLFLGQRHRATRNVQSNSTKVRRVRESNGTAPAGLSLVPRHADGCGMMYV